MPKRFTGLAINHVDAGNNKLTWLRAVCCDVSYKQGLDFVPVYGSKSLVLLTGEVFKSFKWTTHLSLKIHV